MLEIICNTVLQKNILSNNKNNTFNIINEAYRSKSIFDELQKNVLNQIIEFENVSTEYKKKDDKNIICNNLMMNSLLNILNKTDKDLHENHLKNVKNNIKKKKITHKKNVLLDNFYFLKNIKNIKNYKIKKNKNKNQFQTLSARVLSNKLGKNLLSQENILNNLHLIKLKHQYDDKKINFYNTNNGDIKNINNEKNFNSINVKNSKEILFLSKNINKIDYSIRNTHVLKDFNKKELLKKNVDPFFFIDSKNSIEWKKSISQKILLSISNKENQAKIYLQPENLGSIYIKIKMKDDQAILSFISNNNEVRIFLNNCVPFLRDSLNKSGISLRKVNIYSSLKNIRMKDSKKNFNEKFVNSYKLQEILNIYKKSTGLIKRQEIDVYV
ncbi:Flagellar hook-length control protein [Buchnera aphidicola (Brachycaudus tragopogonis)]